MKMDLREKLKDTLLTPDDIKQKLLEIPKWTEEIESIVKNIFEKYWKKEEKILQEVAKTNGRIYIKSIQDIENIEKDKEFKELLQKSWDIKTDNRMIKILVYTFKVLKKYKDENIVVNWKKYTLWDIAILSVKEDMNKFWTKERNKFVTKEHLWKLLEEIVNKE